ncbi:MAG: four helix bundle protein [Bacteroidetes bacterium]|nr:four helix bundle protein [Bacteroidota bacterium]
MKSYRDLEVYKLSKNLAIRIHKMTLALPKFEMYEEASQVRRSSKAVTSAIVEGYGRRAYKGDFMRYLTIGITECDETILHLEFLSETNSLTDKKLFEEFYAEYTSLSKMLNRFIQWIENNLK